VNFSEQIEAYECAKCLPGKYSIALATICTDCSRGFFLKEEGQGDSCTPCPPGSFSSEFASTFCEQCAFGKYNSFSGQSVCRECPMSSTTLTAGSLSQSICVCPIGKYGVPTKESCKSCPNLRGIVCEANSSIPFVLSGFWRTKENLASAQRCFPSEACPLNAFNESTICESGYSGVRCGECESNFYRRNERCNNCPDQWIVWLFFILLFSGALFAYFYSVFSSKRKTELPFRALITGFQTLGILARFIGQENRKSAGLSTLFSIFDLSNLNFSAFLSIECVVKLPFWSLFSLQISSIFIVFIVMYGFGFGLTKLKLKREKTSNSNNFASELEKSISLYFVSLSTLYTFVLSSIFSAFRCFPQEDGSFTLLSASSLNCYDSEWFNHIGAVIIGIIFVFLTPFGIFYILYRKRNHLDSNHFFWKFGVLFRQYEPKYYYWEVITLLWKTVFVCLVDLTNGFEKAERSFLLIIFFALQIFVESFVRPYEKAFSFIFEMRIM
jgi:hypothetical protein